jgi:hypothetical protein
MSTHSVILTETLKNMRVLLQKKRKINQRGRYVRQGKRIKYTHLSQELQASERFRAVPPILR